MADETHLVAQFIQLLKPWLCELRLGVIMEKIWAFSMDQPQLRVLQFAARLIDLLSMPLRCNGFTRIQRAVVDQTSSRPPNSDMTFFWCKFGFGKCFRASSQSNH